jgi:ribosome recycling factor
MFNDIKGRMQGKMDHAIENLLTGLSGIRTGRASLILFDSVQVNYYGTQTPLKQMASLSIPDSRSVLIQPWDLTQISSIEKAIQTSGLGLTPSNDGKVIRIGIPPLTQERRKEMTKWVGKLGEECKVAIRNVRREVNDEVKALQKSGDLSEDDARRFHDEGQKITDQMIAKVDEALHKKEKEIMEV